MSSDGNGVGPNGEQPNRQRRSSITQAAMSNLFQRGGSTGAPPTANDNRRRLSVTTLGLSGTQQTASPSFNLRRGSMSTNSNPDSIDESAIEEDDAQTGAKTAPTTPFVRRMSFGAPAMRGYRTGGSPGNDQSGFNWSEQLRTRAESSVTGARPSFALASSPPRGSVQHDRAKSISDMPQPPAQAPAPKPQPERRKPDAFQERILKGDFYMD